MTTYPIATHVESAGVVIFSRLLRVDQPVKVPFESDWLSAECISKIGIYKTVFKE
jgi:hypothetical protein